jgi:hypothetical protein
VVNLFLEEKKLVEKKYDVLINEIIEMKRQLK